MAETRYIRLKDPWQLRGWQGLPYALVNSDKGAVYFLDEAHYRTACFCNGRFTEDAPVFFGPRIQHLCRFDEIGALDRLAAPADLAPGQEYRRYPNRYLRQVHWSITGSCNYRCRHCYMSAPHSVLPHPSLEECLRIVDQMAACGIPWVSLTGGEPLIRRDFLQIVDRILDHGMHIGVIMTNGSLVTEELLQALEERGCKPEFNMSFDGVEGCHDWLRGVDGAERSVRQAFELCHARGFITGAEFVLHKGNAHTLRQSVRMLGELGVSSLKVNRLSCVGEGEALRDYELGCAEEYETYLDYIPQYVEDGMPVPILTLSALFSARHGKFSVGSTSSDETEDCSGRYICNSARATMYLGPDGRVLPCIPMSQTDASQGHFPKLGELTLAEALSDSTYLDFITTKLSQYLEHNPDCLPCEFKNRCAGGCRGCAVRANGGTDLLDVDPDTCLMFRGGYYDRAKALVDAISG